MRMPGDHYRFPHKAGDCGDCWRPVPEAVCKGGELPLSPCRPDPQDAGTRRLSSCRSGFSISKLIICWKPHSTLGEWAGKTLTLFHRCGNRGLGRTREGMAHGHKLISGEVRPRIRVSWHHLYIQIKKVEETQRGQEVRVSSEVHRIFFFFLSLSYTNFFLESSGFVKSKKPSYLHRAQQWSHTWSPKTHAITHQFLHIGVDTFLAVCLAGMKQPAFAFCPARPRAAPSAWFTLVEQRWCCLWVTWWGFCSVMTVKLLRPGWEDRSVVFLAWPQSALFSVRSGHWGKGQFQKASQGFPSFWETAWSAGGSWWCFSQNEENADREVGCGDC